MGPARICSAPTAPATTRLRHERRREPSHRKTGTWLFPGESRGPVRSQIWPPPFAGEQVRFEHSMTPGRVRRYEGFLFVGPFLALYAFLLIYPLILGIGISFHNADPFGGRRWV